MKTTLTLLAALSSATLAQAAPSVNFTTPVSLGDGLWQVTAQLITSGIEANTLDARFAALTPFNQVLLAGVLPTPDLALANALGDLSAKDTHFLINSATDGYIFGKSPAETDTSLTAAFAIPGQGVYLPATLNVAQIVSTNLYFNYRFVVANAAGQETLLTGTYTPEPATLALLGIGAVAFVRRRRA